MFSIPQDNTCVNVLDLAHHLGRALAAARAPPSAARGGGLTSRCANLRRSQVGDLGRARQAVVPRA